MDSELGDARFLCPIFRLEYQTPDHELERVDRELVTEHYCFKNIAPMASR